MGCKAQTTAIAQLWRGFATPQTSQNMDDRAARNLFSVALSQSKQEIAQRVAEMTASQKG
jgi:hypothetical protein